MWGLHMKPRVTKFATIILALIVIGGALYYSMGEYGSQRFIEGQRDYERFCIRQMTALTLSYVQFHSEIALNSLEQDSAGTFNLSMAELASDLSMLESNLVRSALYIFPKDYPDNETLANMTQTYLPMHHICRTFPKFIPKRNRQRLCHPRRVKHDP